MSDVAALAPPVFVVGSPRSGTTLLYHLLLSAGGFAKYHAETNVFNLLAPRFGDLSVARNRDALLDVWIESEFFRRSGLDPVAFRTEIHERCRSAGDLLRLLMEGVARQQGEQRWAECTPENLLYVKPIATAFPTARFLHIVRDGRDVACSIAEQGWVGPYRRADLHTRVLHAGLYWQWMLRRGRSALSSPGLHVLEIHFESLVERPVETLGLIGAFIGHDLDYSCIRANRLGSVARPNTSFPDEDESSFNPVGRWRSRLDASTLACLEAAIQDELIRNGYALTSDPTQRRAHAASAARARFRARLRFSSRHFLKTRTALGRVFTNTALLHDFHAFDRDRLMPAQRDRSA
jgi:hypothetical protein